MTSFLEERLQLELKVFIVYYSKLLLSEIGIIEGIYSFCSVSASFNSSRYRIDDEDDLNLWRSKMGTICWTNFFIDNIYPVQVHKLDVP